MRIQIHRGQNQIGGSIVEVSTTSTRIILDVGSELTETVPEPPQIEGLFLGSPSYDAVFVTHYHGDHVGLAERVLPGIPIYMGEKAFAVHRASRSYLGLPALDISNFLHSGQTVQIGDIHVTPFLCDHSAFDSYMLVLEHNGKKVLYTGDFRANGRKSFAALLRRLDAVDALIIEGTTLTRDSIEMITESELEAIATKHLQSTDAPAFVLMAATNIDRMVTAYKVAVKSERILLQDVYAASIATSAGENIPNPKSFKNVKTFLTFPGKKQYEILNRFPKAKIGRKNIAGSQFLMCIRPSMLGYLEKLNELRSFSGGILFYSMWEGYKVNDDMNKLLEFMRACGVRIINLHTSGHADPRTIDMLIQDVKPKYIFPVHTENANWFMRYEGQAVIHTMTSYLDI